MADRSAPRDEQGGAEHPEPNRAGTNERRGRDLPATIQPRTDQPEAVESDTETTEPADEPTTDGDQGNGDSAEPLDLVGGLLAA